MKELKAVLDLMEEWTANFPLDGESSPRSMDRKAADDIYNRLQALKKNGTVKRMLEDAQKYEDLCK